MHTFDLANARVAADNRGNTASSLPGGAADPVATTRHTPAKLTKPWQHPLDCGRVAKTHSAPWTFVPSLYLGLM